MAYRDYVHERLEKTSLEMSVEKWQRMQLKSAVAISAAMAVSFYFLTNSVLMTLFGSLISFVIVFFVFVFLLDYFAYLKARDVEETLPEALELLASNMRAGLPVKDSLQLLMTEEFGQLGVEISIATTEMNTGVSIIDALKGTRRRVDSKLYSKTIETLCRSIEGGVNLDTICSALARNINDMHNIRRDIRASTVAYTLFLTFAALIASPILFALSTFLVEASTEIFSIASAQETAAPLGLLTFSTNIPPVELLRNFFLIAIGITSVFTSLGVGIVREGSMRVGLKYVPAFLVAAFVVFFIAKGLIESIVGINI